MQLYSINLCMTRKKQKTLIQNTWMRVNLDEYFQGNFWNELLKIHRRNTSIPQVSSWQIYSRTLNRIKHAI